MNFFLFQSIANEAEYIKESRLLRNNEFYNTSIRQMSKNFFYFPTPNLFNFSCSNNQREINETKNFIDDKIQCGFTSAVSLKLIHIFMIANKLPAYFRSL